MYEVDPLGLLEAMREYLLVRDPDVTVGLACRSFGDKYAVTPEVNPPEEECLQ